MNDELWQRIRTARRNKGLTQEQLAGALSINRAAVSQWESSRPENRTQPNLLNLRRIADVTGVAFDWLSGDGEMAPMAARSATLYPSQAAEPVGLYAIKTDEDPPEDGDELVDVMEVEVGAGNGSMLPDFVETNYRHTYRREFLQSCGVKDSDRVKIFRVRGSSMERVLFNGDKVTFHLDDTRVEDDRMYVIAVSGQLKVKYLRRRRDGGLTILSENKEGWPPEEVPYSELETVQVLGRVIDKSGRGGL